MNIKLISFCFSSASCFSAIFFGFALRSLIFFLSFSIFSQERNRRNERWNEMASIVSNFGMGVFFSRGAGGRLDRNLLILYSSVSDYCGRDLINLRCWFNLLKFHWFPIGALARRLMDVIFACGNYQFWPGGGVWIGVWISVILNKFLEGLR